MKYLQKFNENSQSMKIYIVLYCFWEGDGNLIYEYRDCFLTMENAVSFAEKLKWGESPIKIYTPNDFGLLENPPEEEDGHYGTTAFAQIIEKIF